MVFSLVFSNAFAAPMLPSFKDIVKKVSPAVVYVEVSKEQALTPWMDSSEVKGSGSGVIIDGKKGVVLTANHVVEDASEVKVLLEDGREFIADEILSDPQTDIALIILDIDETLPEALLGDSDALEVGEWVLAIGSPMGKMFANSVSAGIVSGKGRKTRILGQLGIEDYIQTDAVINRGNSGGPLIDINGNIVGINSSILSATGMNAGLGFAVPSNLIDNVVRQLLETGQVSRGWLGVTITSLQDLKDEYKEKIPEEILTRGGAFVVEMQEDSPAKVAGVLAEDVIISINDKDVTSSDDLIKIISNMKPNTEITCKIIRNNDEETVKIKLGVRPGTSSALSASLNEEEKNSNSYKKLGIVVTDREEKESRFGFRRTQAGVIVKYVKKNSIADEFGIRIDDVILKINKNTVKQSDDFNELLKDIDVKEGVVLTVQDEEGEKKVYLKKF